MRRRVVRPLRSAVLLVALGIAPLVGLLSRQDQQARTSVIHVVITFVVLMIAFRLIGKRELGRLSAFELVTLMLIPEILSNTLQGQGTLLQSLAGLSTILLLVVLTSLVAQRFSKLQAVFESPPSLLVVDGRMLEDNLNKERIAPDELFSEMRKQGLERLENVRFAILESSGNITFIATDPRSRGGAAADDEEPSAA